MNIRRSDIVFVLLGILLLYLAWLLRATLLLVYVAAVLAVIFIPVVAWIQRLHIGRRHPGRGASILLLLAAVGLLLTLLGVLAAPPIAADMRSLVQELPENLAKLRSRVSQYPLGTRIAGMLEPDTLQQHLAGFVQQSFKTVRGVAGGLLNFVMLGILTAYFMLDGERAFAWSLSLVPASERTRLRGALLRGRDRMERWLAGQMLLMLILGTSSLIVFWALGVRYFFVLAVIAGIANFVPIVGPVVSVLLASAVAALDSWTRLLGVLIFYLVYQQIENAFLTPRIMRSTVALSGLTVVIALAVGGALAGVPGAIVAVPTAALLDALADEYLVRRDAPDMMEEPLARAR